MELYTYMKHYIDGLLRRAPTQKDHFGSDVKMMILGETPASTIMEEVAHLVNKFKMILTLEFGIKISFQTLGCCIESKREHFRFPLNKTSYLTPDTQPASSQTEFVCNFVTLKAAE